MTYSAWSFYNPFASQFLPVISADSLTNNPVQLDIVQGVFAQLGYNAPVTAENIAKAYAQYPNFTNLIVEGFANSQNVQLSDEQKEQVKTVLGGILKEIIKQTNQILTQKGEPTISPPVPSEIQKNEKNLQQDYTPFLFFGGVVLTVLAFFVYVKKQNA